MTADKKTVLVTGGAGYIGSHACKALAKAGYAPVTFDNLGTGHRELVRWGPLEEGDVCDERQLEECFAKYRPEAVLHFAGLISVAESVRQPDKYYQNNVTGTLTLLSAMRQAGIKKLIFSSSCAVHGLPPSLPIKEDMPCRPLNPYGENKWMMEQAIQAEAKAFGLSAVILRYFNAAGADPEGETGECHDPETHLIPLAIEAALHGRPFHLYGTDYDTEDGTAVRDYIHVSDLAHAHVLALEYLAAAPGVHVFNVGTGRGISVAEVVRAVESACGRKIDIALSPRREGDAPSLFADPSRAQKILRFTLKRSDIVSIVQTALAWHQRK